ncbi:hypothetical protein SAMN05216553_114114 [Lentzea fradiae]|uniref:Uncharacterized protein n=1 Tax=Lentzea fradiae TaxID=200378 RepID=A0A1G7YRR1_9PSEU|nr:hypothetical protein SAMN05216553_114114 [Lentzea fradiae]
MSAEFEKTSPGRKRLVETARSLPVLPEEPRVVKRPCGERFWL